MKTTGVVRRIDDLGRIVIPKEIRRNLRIRDGESLEIFLDSDTISLKKYSSMKEMKEIAVALANVVNNSLDKNVFITDRDSFVATAGDLKKEYIDKNISAYLTEVMNNRITIKEEEFIKLSLIDEKDEKASHIIIPIIMNGDAIGLVIIFSNKEGINDIDIRLATIVSKFLGNYIEE